jgi:peptide/nickel transport system substrate-binding protein
MKRNNLPPRAIWLPLVTILALMFLLASCTQSAETPQASTPSTTEQSIAEAQTTAAERNGSLRVATQPIVQIDPAQISSDSEVFIANHIYDYLVDIDPASQIIPRLATQWTTSDDGLIYTFTLAEGVAFHDGTPFSAGDVVWTFNRLRDPQSGFPTADLYQNIENVTANGDLEVIFTLKEPNPFFLYDLSDNHALIMKENTADAADFNGTGPFKVVSYSPEDRIVLQANDQYYIEGLPKLAGMEVIFFADDTAAVDAVRGGQVDLVMRLPISLYEGLKGQTGISAFDVPTNKFDVVRLRSDRAPGNDPRVIQAFKLATDRDALFQLVQQGYGAVGKDSPIGPLYPTYFADDLTVPDRDVEAARQLLAEAGFADGIQLDLHVPDSEGRPDLAAALKNQWAEAGIDVNIIVEPESVYYGDNGWLEVDLGITGWGSRPYPQFYLDVMLVCNAKWNEAHFCDEEFDRLARLAGSTLDEDERVAAYEDIQRILIERGPIIVPYFSAQTAAIRDVFQDFQLKAFAGRTDVRNVSLVK